MERSRNFVFTLNNYTPEEVELVKQWDCKYLIFGKEVGEAGTPHLQGYVSFANQKTLSALKKYSGRAHWEVARGTPKQAAEYCEKDGDVFEKGTRPLSQVEKGDTEKRRWAVAFDCVQDGRLEELDKEILCNHLRSVEYAVKRVREQKRPKAKRMDVHPVCLWIWGPSGTGKTHFVDSEYPDAYRKDVNTRNWDDYDDQDVVYWEDVDRSFAQFGGDMKRMADRTPFPIKKIYEGVYLIRPGVIVVTSNYHPCEIWQDSKILSPLMNRFTLIKKTEVYVPPIPQDPAISTDTLPNIELRTPDPAGAERLAGGAAEERSDDNPGSPGRLEFMNANGW